MLIIVGIGFSFRIEPYYLRALLLRRRFRPRWIDIGT